MLITEKITTGPSNVQAWLTPFEEREEPEEQHQYAFQFHQEDLRRHQQLDTRQDEMQQDVNQEHSQHKQQQHQTQAQQLTRSEELLQQLHQQVQHQQQELQKLQQRNPCNIIHNHFKIGMLMLVLFLMKNETL